MKKSRKTPPKARNPFALHALQRKAGYIKDKREGRKGNRNLQRDYQED